MDQGQRNRIITVAGEYETVRISNGILFGDHRDRSEALIGAGHQ